MYKKMFLFFVLIVLVVGMGSAIRFSPTSHVTYSEPGETVCKRQRLDVGSDNVNIYAKYAPSYETAWRTYLMSVQPSELGINVSITPLEPIWGMKTYKVCYSYPEKGYFKGALFFSSLDETGFYRTRGAVWILGVVR